MNIILNADDFGYSEDTVEATIELFGQRALSSASIMPKMPATELAVRFVRQHPEFSFGIHLTFITDSVERPVTNAAELPSLTTQLGTFRRTNDIRLRALLGFLSEDEIVAELNAQIRLIVDWGVNVSHVDSHKHVHKLGLFQNALRRALPIFNIKCVRNVQNIYLKRAYASPTYWLGKFVARSLSNTFVTTDAFFMPTGAELGPGWPQLLLARLSALEKLSGCRTLEIGLHPGFHEEWRREEHDVARRLSQDLVTAGHRLISWHQLAEGA
jgi:chitin disaccharide deacetylase